MAVVAATQPQKSEDAYKLICQKAGITGEDAVEITDFIAQAMQRPANERLNYVCNRMRAVYGQKKGIKLYRRIKDFLQKV